MLDYLCSFICKNAMHSFAKIYLTIDIFYDEVFLLFPIVLVIVESETCFFLNAKRRCKLDFAFEETIALRPDRANVKAYIDSKYSEHITLDSLASIANMSKFHLVREFSKALGESPIEYLQNKRIDEAKVLLVSTGMSVSQISSSVGFSSSSYFSQRFKLTLGITPMEFRSGIKM